MNKLEKIRNHYLENGKEALSEDEYMELHNFRMSYRDSLRGPSRNPGAYVKIGYGQVLKIRRRA